MNIYIQTGPIVAGNLMATGFIKQVSNREDASRIKYGDAQFLCKQAQAKWPGGQWEIERVGDRYIVESEG
jgi:hypothetical protein